MKYKPIFTLQLEHSYYTDGRCLDFLLEPTLETQKLLQKYHCRLKLLPDGCQVFASVNADNTLFIPLQKGLIFTFYLRLQNPEFQLFTDISDVNRVEATLYTNIGSTQADPVQLVLVSRRAWTTESFLVPQPAQASHFTLSGRPLNGLQLSDFSITGLETGASVTQYEAVSKIVTVNTQNAKREQGFTIKYPTTPPREKNTFANIEINLADSLTQVSTNPLKFRISFKPKAVRWKYYVLTNSTNLNFQVVDADKVGLPLVFDAAPQPPKPTDIVANGLLNQYPGTTLLSFVSATSILCQQEPKKTIQLKLDGSQVGGALPNPYLRDFSTIDVVTNGQSLDALFQVVKYLTQ